MKKMNVLVISLLMVIPSIAQNFVTGGNGIRNVESANINGKPVFYISELDGAISCYTRKGDEIWRNETPNSAVNFEIVSADVDNDGNDDVLAVSGDGHIYCWKSNGKLFWKYKPDAKVRLSELAVVGTGADMQIFAGGNNYKLYEIDVNGKQVSVTYIKGMVRKIESGKFIDSDKEVLLLFTLKHDKYSSEFFGFIDPSSKKVIKSTKLNTILKGYKGLMVHHVEVADVNKDKKDEILVFGTAQGASFAVIDGNFKKTVGYIGPNKDKQRYAYTYGTCLLPYKEQIVFQMGGVLYVTDLQGNLLGKSGKKHEGIIYNGFVCESESGKLYGAGQIGGGNGMYCYDLSNKNWWNTEHQWIGRIKEVEDNLNALYKQAAKFKMPNYQKKSDKEFVMITGIGEKPEVKRMKGQVVKYVKQYIWPESTDRTYMVEQMGDIALKRDKRKKYKLSRMDIINMAKEHEAENKPFSIWAGHGSDPYITQIETLEEITKVAPNTCYGFIYAEMGNTKDPRVIHFVRQAVPRLAKAIRANKSKAKLYFRYKNMFWAADCHAELWQEMFFSNKYNDILVPSAEDTNNRLQDLNFSGRVGMFTSGYVDNYAMRLVDDNPTSWRPLSPGGQRSASPYVRNGAIMAAYGCRHGILFNISYLEDPGMNVLFALMKSGVIPIVEREDILSIGSYHLVNKVDEHYIETKANNGHDLCKYEKEDENHVVSVAGVHWCGADVPEHDYSKIALGVNYRWLNFMPEMPNGMVPITHADYEAELKKKQIDYFVSDIKHGYVDGKKVSGKAFGTVMKNIVENGGEKLILTVNGASWSLIKLDDKHARLVLVDPGYVDPQDRDAVVTFQSKKPLKATNILTGENVSIKSGKMNVIVPAGSMSFIDLEFDKL